MWAAAAPADLDSIRACAPCGAARWRVRTALAAPVAMLCNNAKRRNTVEILEQDDGRVLSRAPVIAICARTSTWTRRVGGAGDTH